MQYQSKNNHSPKTKESVCCIIFNEKRDQVLLIKRRDIPVWTLPGGGIEAEENPLCAAKREAEEETGFQIEILRKIAKYIPENRFTRITHFYEGKILGGAATESQETKQIDFFPLAALPYKLVDFYRGWIQDALETKGDRVLEKKIQGTCYRTFLKYFFTHPFLVIRFLLTRLGMHINY